MTGGVAAVRPDGSRKPARAWLAAAGATLVLLALVPPLSVLAGRYEWFDALRFSIFALVGPALVTVGAPWRALRLDPSLLSRLAAARRRHPEPMRSFGFLAADLVVIVAWRTPAAVDAASRQPLLVVVEAFCLVVAGIGLWLELVESPPLVPRATRPRRALLAALAMWTVWTLAYMVAMGRVSWYRGFHHLAGVGLSASADRQLSSVVLWAVAGATFMPVIFWNLVQWLRSEDDPDDELYRLLRDERRRTTAVTKGPGGAQAPVR
jgi:cytochrome c oxidase assembly factor CtaG